MGKYLFGMVILGMFAIAFIFGIVHIESKQNQIKEHNKEFYETQYNDFLRNLETRDNLSNLYNYDKIKAENTLRYEEEKGQPQIIWGSIIPPADSNMGEKFNMSLDTRPRTGYHKKTYADEHKHFAFEKVEPNEYQIVLFETSACPGMRLENITVKEGQSMPEIKINIEQASIKVIVRDMSGNVIKDVQVLVGKSSGGANGDLYTWRHGLSNSEGNYTAKNLTDGLYVVSVQTQRQIESITTQLNKDEHKEVEITMTHNIY